MITKILTDASNQTGVYYDEGGHPMLGSALVCDPKFQERVVAETRALLATIPSQANDCFGQAPGFQRLTLPATS